VLGSKIAVYWPDDEKYYNATVSKQRGSSSTFWLEYYDGESEWIDLATEDFRLLLKNDKDKGKDKDKDKDDKKKKISSPKAAPSTNTNKRRRIDEESDEEENEWNEDESDDEDGSVYDPKSAPKEEEQDDQEEVDQWMVTDGEEEDDENDVVVKPTKKKKAKASLKVTRHSSSERKSPSTSPPRVTTPTTTSSASYKTPLRQFANTVSPPTNSSIKKRLISSPPALTNRSSTSTSPSPQPETTTPTNKVLPYTKGAVNPRGSHVHNHLNFLIHPKDLRGRQPGDPDYDSRTLKVRDSDWEKHCGKMTNAVQQWWDLKSQYFDTVLLFKTGKLTQNKQSGSSREGLHFRKIHRLTLALVVRSLFLIVSRQVL
jgi:DNA mismatch repair protein MSH6